MDKLTTGIDAVRVQLNFCSDLSQQGRHEEGFRFSSSAKQNLDTLLENAQQLEASEKVDSLMREVRMLQCATLIAQAIDAQQLGQDEAIATDGLDASTVPASASLYKEANELAEAFLPKQHPMVTLTRSFCKDRAVCVTSDDDDGQVRGDAPLSPSKSSPSNSRPRPRLLGALPVQNPSDRTAEVARSGHSTPSRKPTEKGASEKPLPVEAGVEASKTKSSTKLQPEATDHVHSGPVHAGAPGQGELHSSKGKNIFADFVADIKIEREMNKPWFNNRQDELRNHVMEQARFVRLQDHGKDITALADPRFTTYGHSLQVKVLSKRNMSRSEPSLLKQTKQAGAASPEVYLTRQLRHTLDPNAKVVTNQKRKKKEHHE